MVIFFRITKFNNNRMAREKKLDYVIRWKIWI